MLDFSVVLSNNTVTTCEVIMITLHQSQDSILHWFITNSNGFLEDLDDTVDTLEWRIFEAETAYTQVEPVAGWNLLNLVANHVSLGKYKIEWTVPGGASIGRYFLEVRITDDGVVLPTQRMEFEVIAEFIPLLEAGTHMCLIRDLRAEGVAATVTDWRLAESIMRGDAFIEHYCRRKFGHREGTFKVEATFDYQVMLPEPIVGLESVAYDSDGTFLDLEDAEVYNRHLRKDGGAPIFGDDDRDNPKIYIPELLEDVIVLVKGLWGYTQPDTTYVGKLPDQVRLAAINLALKYTTALIGSGGGSGVIPSFSERLIEEKTATQSYKLSPLDSGSDAWNMVAGDTELVRLLKPYVRPIQLDVV